MSALQIVAMRGGRRESEHLISAAIVDERGALCAFAHEPGRWTYWRSAAKPLQAIPFLESGAFEAYGFDDEVLALACASHSSAPKHMEIAARVLRACGAAEEDLACGPHPPILGDGISPKIAASHPWTPLSSNCSGKHAAMIALAKHLGVASSGYEIADHPVQQAILAAVADATGMGGAEIGLAVDGCRAPTFYLPLTAMARAWARLGGDSAVRYTRLRQSMWRHPDLVAGEGRSCTQMMTWGREALLAKIGAEGVYCAALPREGLGIALKIHSGDMRVAPIALCAILAEVDERFGRDPRLSWLHDTAPAQRALHHPAILNTRAEPVGAWEVLGGLTWK